MDNIIPIENQDQKPLSEKIDTSNSSQETLQFTHHYAFIIGIDAYEKVSSLSTAVNDAKKVAEVLKDKHHFEVIPPLLDPKGNAIRTLLHDTMPKVVGNDDRVVFYFAGHGIASDGDDGPTGYIAPADADTADMKTFIPMTEVKEALNNLTCRHLLVILDCCFAGAFKWTSGTRSIRSLMPKKIYKERFDRFIHDPAWEVITSAAYDQRAMDNITKDQSTGERGLIASESGENHSPFAFALFNALAGEADAKTGRESDGLITVTELYSYIRDQVELATIEMGQQKDKHPDYSH
ncbi:MAG: caspase family protein [Saprospiraceae bacterium]|nr:caspase family protein [Saprospiraceae bacterium]